MIVKVKDLITHHASGPSPTCEERNISGDAEWGLLKTTAVTWNGWNAAAHKVPPKQFWGNRSLEVRAGDVIITKAGPRDRCGVSVYVPDTPPRIMVSGKMILLRPDTSKTNAPYLASALASDDVQRYLDARTTGLADAQLNFTNQLLLDTEVDLPERAAQERIGEIRTVIDEAIEKTEALIAKANRIKSGLMHDLFTRGVTPDGQLRPSREEAPQLYSESPLGWIPRDWDLENLSNLGDFMNGLNLPKDQFGFGVKFVNILDVYPERLELDGLGLMNASRMECARYGLLSNDVLIDRSSVKLEGVGYPTIFPETEERVVFCGFIIRFRLTTERLSGRFVVAVMRSAAFRRLVMRIATVSANINVNQRALGALPMVIPAPDEQTRISERLDHAIQAIEQEEANLSKLRCLKSGLMGDLLTGAAPVSDLGDAALVAAT